MSSKYWLVCHQSLSSRPGCMYKVCAHLHSKCTGQKSLGGPFGFDYISLRPWLTGSRSIDRLGSSFLCDHILNMMECKLTNQDPGNPSSPPPPCCFSLWGILLGGLSDCQHLPHWPGLRSASFLQPLNPLDSGQSWFIVGTQNEPSQHCNRIIMETQRRQLSIWPLGIRGDLLEVVIFELAWESVASLCWWYLQGQWQSDPDPEGKPCANAEGVNFVAYI